MSFTIALQWNEPAINFGVTSLSFPYWLKDKFGIHFLLLAIMLFAKDLSASGFLDFNAYPYMSDVSNDNTLTINAFAKLPQRFSYFSLTNFSNQLNRSELSKLDNYYTEQNLRWQISQHSSLDLTVQLNFRSGDNNDRHRLGVRWRLNDSTLLKDFFEQMHISYSINFHVVQFDHESGNVWQMEHVIGVKFPAISERLYLSGFVDHTFNQNLPATLPENPVVAEFQLGYRLIEQLYLVSEYRINQYRRSDVNNLAIGLEYKVLW